MDPTEFVKDFVTFNKAYHAYCPNSTIDDQASVALFGIWFTAKQKKEEMEAMGLGNLMSQLGGMIQGTTDEIDRQNESESWKDG